jgi:hypothetical protein
MELATWGRSGSRRPKGLRFPVAAPAAAVLEAHVIDIDTALRQARDRLLAAGPKRTTEHDEVEAEIVALQHADSALRYTRQIMRRAGPRRGLLLLRVALTMARPHSAVLEVLRAAAEWREWYRNKLPLAALLAPPEAELLAAVRVLRKELPGLIDEVK